MAKGKIYGGRCGSNACVEVAEVIGGFRFTSTIDGNGEGVTYTPEETANFLADVKAGKYDALHRDARERAESVSV